MKDERKLPYRKNPHLVPDDYKYLKFSCNICNSNLNVDWTEDTEYPATPIASNDGKGYFLPVSIQARCENSECRELNHLPVPRNPVRGGMSLFGDEAARDVRIRRRGDVRNARFSCISLVNLTLEKHGEFKKKFDELKLLARPDISPDEWSHHFSDIWGAHSDNSIYAFSSVNEKIVYAKKVASLIRSYNPYLAVFNYSSCIFLSDGKERANEVNWQNEDLFKQAILLSIHDIRSAGYIPKWFFDNVKDRKNPSEAAVEGWASECFRGIQYTRLYTWLASGAKIDEPNFVIPGSHFLLEISDFICFWIARGFLKKINRQKVELATHKLGVIHGYGTNGRGEVQGFSGSVGFPYKAIYGI